MHLLTPLLDHLAWADARALDTLRAMPPGAAETERARLLYAHVAAAEHVWLSRLAGRTPLHVVWPDLSLDAAAALATECAAGLRALVATLDDAALARAITYRTSTGAEFTNTVGEVLAQVVLHGSYHRGQLALLARGAGTAPAATDFIVWARG